MLPDWLGYSVFPLSAGQKTPACQWATDYRTGILAGQNTGIRTGRPSGVVVVDCDDRDAAVWFWTRRGRTPMVALTPRGAHLYFRWPGREVRNGVRIDGRWDVRGDGGYVVAPPSVVGGVAYQWLRGPVAPTDLPAFNLGWLPRRPARAAKSEPPVVEGDAFERARAYISRCEPAVSGQGGHGQTFKVACHLVLGFQLGEAVAMELLAEFNERCKPPWSERELAHKVRSAMQQDGPRGYLL